MNRISRLFTLSYFLGHVFTSDYSACVHHDPIPLLIVMVSFILISMHTNVFILLSVINIWYSFVCCLSMKVFSRSACADVRFRRNGRLPGDGK